MSFRMDRLRATICFLRIQDSAFRTLSEDDIRSFVWWVSSRLDASVKEHRIGLCTVKSLGVIGETTQLQDTVLLNDFSRLWSDIGPDAESAFSLVGRSGWYILGQEVQAFEAALAVSSGTSRAIGCASGLDAIEIGLRALDLAPNEPVLTTPLSAFATTLAIIRAGGRPVFVDVDDDGLLDLKLADQAFQAEPTMRAFVPVHLYGRSLDLARLQSLKEKFNLRIVEDMAQAIGATWNGRPVGSVGQVAAVSFYPTKNLGCLGDGGAILVADDGLARRCLSLRDYGQSSKYVHSELGLNSRLDEVQAAILHRAMLPRLAEWTKRRREIAEEYGSRIVNSRVILPRGSSESAWHLYPVRSSERDSLAVYLGELGIQSTVHYPILISQQEALRDFPASPPTPKAQEWASQVLSLPIHPYLTDSEISRVVDAVNSWTS